MATGDFDLPESVRQIAEVIGRQKALELVGAVAAPLKPRGSNAHGRRSYFYVPTVENARGSRLAEIVGEGDALKLAHVFGGETLWIGTCKAMHQRFRDDAVRRMLAQGVSTSQVAWLFDITPRHVQNLKA